jgi:hypothetical protein
MFSSCRASSVLGAGEVSLMRACRIVFMIVLFQVEVRSCWYEVAVDKAEEQAWEVMAERRVGVMG